MILLAHLINLWCLEAAQTIVHWCQYTALERFKLKFPFAVPSQSSKVIKLYQAFILQCVINLIYLILYLTKCLRITHIIRIYIRLSQQGVIHCELCIEAKSAIWRQKQAVLLIVSG